VTPTSYLELLTTFLKLLGEKRTEVSEAKKRLVGGLDKLTNTAAQVRLGAGTSHPRLGRCKGMLYTG
jgi:dynein heavy chain